MESINDISLAAISCPNGIGTDLKCLVQGAGEIMNALVPLLFGIALLIFLWGVIKYISQGGDPKARAEGRNFIIFGIIGFAIMMTVWGLALLVKNTFFPGAPTSLPAGSSSNYRSYNSGYDPGGELDI